MQSRTYRDVAHFDRAVAQFRIAVDAMRAGDRPKRRRDLSE